MSEYIKVKLRRKNSKNDTFLQRNTKHSAHVEEELVILPIEEEGKHMEPGYYDIYYFF